MPEELSFKSVGIKSNDPDLFRAVQIRPVGIKTPLELGTGRSGLFQMHFDVADQLMDNLRNLLLTNHGERLGVYDYGANLRPLTFDLSAKDDWDAEAMLRINTAVSKFIPHVDLETFTSSLSSRKESNIEGEWLAHVRLILKFNIPVIGVTNRTMAVNLWCVG